MVALMPIYTYETIPTTEGEEPLRFEIQQKMADPPLKEHPETGQPVKRIITGGSVIFHGPSIMSMNTKGGRGK